jgi:hypothetical protein
MTYLFRKLATAHHNRRIRAKLVSRVAVQVIQTRIPFFQVARNNELELPCTLLP